MTEEERYAAKVKEVEETYRYLDASACPFCKSMVDLEGGPLEYEGSIITQLITCTNCDRTWIDVFHWVGAQFEPKDIINLLKKEQDHAQS